MPRSRLRNLTPSTGPAQDRIDMECGSAHTDLLDLSDDEVVDLDVFCTAVVIVAYGMDAIKIAKKQRLKRKKYKRGEMTAHE